MPRLPTELFTERQLVSDPAELVTYEADAGLDRAMPDAVFFPDTTEDMRKIVEWARKHGSPIVARGSGTGLAGGAVAARGGIVVATSRLNRIIDIDPVSRLAFAEAGAVNLDLETSARQQGLYYPPDPASGRSCAIGGNLATNAGGPHCFKYGVTSNYVSGLEVVLADGTAVTLGGRAFDYPGYDLCGLVVGSEGTLGLIARAILRLITVRPAVRTMTVSFETLEEAGAAVSAVIAAGLIPATLEAIDKNGMRVIEEYCQPGLPVDAGAVLIVDLDGYPESLDSQAAQVAAVLEQHRGRDVHLARTEAERERIWHGRKSAAGAMARLAPTYYLTDVTVRRSRLASVLGRIREICAGHGLQTASFFHAGDGNLHPLIPGDPSEPGWLDRVHQAMQEIIALCIAEDGSITGEHGVGMEKRADMLQMHGGSELSAMWDVKKSFDPESLFNPGKVLPAESPPFKLAEPLDPEGQVAAPVSAEQTAGILRSLSESGRGARIGSASNGNRDGADVWLSTSRLRGIQTFAPEDLFVSVGAGTRVEKIHAFLEPRGLRLPLSTPWPQLSAGGLVASNLNSPQRLRYGAVRDLTLCATVALADGRMLRSGRPLVKNVAGYDLTKVFVGCAGTLGVLVDITFKLVPAPRARRTLTVAIADPPQGVDLAHSLLSDSLMASGVTIGPGGNADAAAPDGLVLLYTAEGLKEEVDIELDHVQETLSAQYSGNIVETSRSASRAWEVFLGSADENCLLVRAGVPLKSLSEYARTVPRDRPQTVFLDCAAGLVFLIYRVENVDDASRWLESVRQPALSLGGYAVAISLPIELRGRLDPWGYRPDALGVMRRLKKRWDPTGALNPGGSLVDPGPS